MIARNSFLEFVSSERISRLSSEIRHEALLNDKKWEWHHLRIQCKSLQLEHFYRLYMQRLRISYLTLFLIIAILEMGMHLLVLLGPLMNSAFNEGNIFAYATSALLACGILAINFRAELIEQYPWMMSVTSWMAVIILAITDIGVSVYHVIINSCLIIPAYGSYILYAVYIFMPLPENVHAFIMGMVVTVLYLITYAILTSQKLSYGTKTFGIEKLITEAIFLMSINFLGIYFRLMKEINIRITFLDRHKLVGENFILRYAREEEQRLLLSIIPGHIVNKIENHIKSRLKVIMARRHSSSWRISFSRDSHIQKTYIRQPELEELFIEPHDDVTILYADVVNYSSLTTKLDVKTLVETLHDLFVKFDKASKEYNVLRIKFLGDCYYAVAGLSVPNEHHAKCCVDLGLHMIKDIRDVSENHKLYINMRIGVHTGSILSGVIGACKLQYDIWSKDVDIANHLEKTGAAGRVHVSEETLKQLNGEYLYEEGTPQAKEDPVLNKFGIRTFLIQSPSSVYNDQGHPEQAQYAESVEHFMQSKMQRVNVMSLQDEVEMCRDLQKMPLGTLRFTSSKGSEQEELEEQKFRRNISSLFLYYKDLNWELEYLREPDDMLKYSVTMAVIIFYAIMTIQWINKVQSTNTIYILLMIICLFLTWFKKLWMLLFAKTMQSVPNNICILFLFNASKQIQSSITARMAIYLLIVLANCSATFLQLLDCRNWPIYSTDGLSHPKTLHELAISGKCEMSFDTWGITESLELTIIMMFPFSRIPFLVKLTLGVLITITYWIVIFGRYLTVYKSSPSTDIGMPAEFSHILVIVVSLVIFFIMDRQTEYISKVDFNLRLQLQKQQEDAEITNASITMLIKNILPTHVADIYMSKQMINELYYEDYDNVAVMFATIRKYDIEIVGLKVLNQIICDFDEVVKRFEAEGIFKVEKIKLAGWTYMAACGLNVRRFQSGGARNLYRQLDGQIYSRSTKSSNENEPSTSKKSLKKLRRHSISFPLKGYVVYVMAQFALELMKKMRSLNMDWGDPDYGMLRIGISNGPTMAGVIGSSKPHYDIWGNCVNMASRMDTTGLPGLIQVTSNTAEVLQSFNIQCNFRGMTFVKGCGKIPTYFIDIDENLNFVQVSGRSTRNTLQE